jgi:thiamine biosynthesis lipoprotein
VVNLGADLRDPGPAPEAGWAIGIADDHRALAHETDQTVTIRQGAIATSSVATRRWVRAGTVCHHILDPGRGRPAATVWRTVSVSAGSCVIANTASTAAIVAGGDAVGRLVRAGLAARLVAADGSVVTVGGWPGAARREVA